ncbi:MAG TPA: glycosyltransferase family 2 protein [Terriglobales bacterium]|nr:glycosyltransferase family 2 protein [Terriglobales bacterium]
MSVRPKIGAVTVTYNSGQVIDGFLTSMLRQNYCDFVVYVVDNDSSDETLIRLDQYRDPRLRVIANQRNVGFAEGSNQGIRAALDEGCGAVLLINNDTEFEPQLLDKLAQGLDEHDCDMTAPKILYCDRQEMIWSAGGAFNPLKGYAAFHYGLDELDSGQFDTPRVVAHAPACCLLIKRHVFDTIGLMDPLYFVYLDDTDFCYRAMRAGLRICYLPSAVLLHKASALTGGPESDFSVRFRTRNQIYFMLKHLGLWRNSYYLPAFQLFQMAKLLSRKIDLHGFALRQRAFFEGLRLWMQATSR